MPFLRYLCLLTILCAAGANPALADPVRVFLLAGQSNADGRAPIDTLTEPYSEPLPGVSVFMNDRFDTAGGGESVGRRWSELQPGLTCIWDSDLAVTRFGPELGFGHAISAALPDEKIAIIKFAEGSTNLAVDWNPGVDGSERGYFLRTFLNTVTDALASFPEDDEPILSGMLWMQGESDANDLLDEGWYIDYEQNLTDLIQVVRDYCDTPELPFIVGQIANGADYPHTRDVQLAQYNVSHTVENVKLIQTSDLLEPWIDTVHYQTAGMLALGERFAGAMLPLLPIAGDLNGDGTVNSDDLDIVRGDWGRGSSAIEGDSTENGIVDSDDLNIVRGAWGQSVDGGAPAGDLTGDGIVNSDDLDIIRGAWGRSDDDEVLAGDPTRNGIVNGDDLDVIRGAWGRSLDGDVPDGDLTEDGIVNSDDLDIIRGAWGQSVDGGGPDGDPTEDGIVNGDDLDVIRANWGTTSAAAVPEPGTLALLIVGVIFGLRRSRR